VKLKAKAAALGSQGWRWKVVDCALQIPHPIACINKSLSADEEVQVWFVESFVVRIGEIMGRRAGVTTVRRLLNEDII
jgi:hypothetical protein